MRIPRKIKKAFKKDWHEQTGVKLLIVKSSIEKKIWECSDGRVVWGFNTKNKN